MYGKNLSGHTYLVLRPIKALLLLLFPAFEGLHDNIKFVITACIQRKLFKGNDRQGEREQTILWLTQHIWLQFLWESIRVEYGRMIRT